MLSTICEMRWMVLCTKMMFSLLLTKSMTDLDEWLSVAKGKEGHNWIAKHCNIHRHTHTLAVNYVEKLHGKGQGGEVVCRHAPPPDMDVALQRKQQVSEQPLVHGRPLELWDAEHGGSWARAELTSLLLRHGHPPKAQVYADVLLHRGGGWPSVQTLTESNR